MVMAEPLPSWHFKCTLRWPMLLLLLATVSAVPSDSSKPKVSPSVMPIQSTLAKKQLEKELSKTKSKLKHRKITSPAANSGDGASIQSSSRPSSVMVEAFLIPRKFSLRLLVRATCVVGMLWSVFLCVQTRGVPFANAVWEILYGDDVTRPIRPPPPGYFPSSADVHLAQFLAQMSKTLHIMIPPASMPSAGPILGVVFSVFAYFGLTYLIPQWSTQFRIFLDFVRTDSLELTTEKIGTKKNKRQRQTLSNGENVLVRLDDDPLTLGKRQKTTVSGHQRFLISPLYQASTIGPKTATSDNATLSLLNDNFAHPTNCYFEVNHCRVYCDPKTKICFDGAPTLHESKVSSIQRLVEDGGLTKRYRRIAQERYEPYNTFDLASPTLKEAFLRRISSPLVVIQFVGRLMSLLEEGKAAMLSMVESLLEHYNDARQAIQSAKQMAKEVKTNLQDTSGCIVSVWRSDKSKWVRCKAGDLVPGDIFRLHSSDTNLVVPVDALVVKGQCLTNEAVLTGESVPQVKVPLDFEEVRMGDDDNTGEDKQLDLQRDRSSVLFAGTTMLGADSSSLGGTKDNTLTCLALRTGTYSSKGQLLQALKGSGHVGAISNAQSEKDAMRLIACLSVCAAMSCGSLFVRRNGNMAKVSPFRRVIQCTRIILACIPSSLPLALASVAKTCSGKLRQLADVACSEPGSLLTAAYVDTVVFDKTGTLTADTQSLSKLVLPLSTSRISEDFQHFLLAGCHSLVQFHDGDKGRTSLIGDTLDKAAFLFSGWKYDVVDGSFALPHGCQTSLASTSPVRLWQISNFPFDPSRRLSSSIVVVQLKNSCLELWRLTKGSPEAVQTLYQREEDNDFVFEDQTKQLEAKGFRSISLGGENLTHDSICQQLFPKGLSVNPEILNLARSKSESLHRSNIENRPLINCGFACFHAAIRSSSRRVINELNGSHIDCIMLTGDSMDAALSVATKIDLIKPKKLVVLELSHNSSPSEKRLVWRKIKCRIDHEGVLNETQKLKPVTVASVRKFLSCRDKGSYSIAASGPALEHVLNNPLTNIHKLILRNVGSISIIARATPELKKEVIDCLRSLCGRRVMMCGDGVNDVAAIQAADVAAALLNGFGAELDLDTAGIDIDDKRRTKKLKLVDIGSNRKQNAAKLMQKAKQHEANQRIRDQIRKAREEIDERVGKRQNKQYTADDLKEIIAASFKAYRDERDRVRKLQKGGGDAARILADERRREGKDIEEHQLEDNDGKEEIKPGEVSLVSSFSCLHPSIDGVDAILREGVATAASALATQQSIALYSLLSCVRLATLYRDGFRYSQKMIFCEQIMYFITDAFRYRASCNPRPRLPSSIAFRPPTTMFEPGSMVTTVGQALSHLLFMSGAVSYSKGLGSLGTLARAGKIGLNSLIPFGDRLGKVVNTLSKYSLQDTEDGSDENNSAFSFFRRPAFKPNYETNMVFLFSVIQFVISSVLNHRGRPFYHGILESREFCKACCLSVVFFMVCVTGISPRLNAFLDVKSFPSAKSKLVVVGLAAGNAFCCILFHWLATHFFDTNVDKSVENESNRDRTGSPTAADLEERLLREESETNALMVKMFCGLLVYFLIDIIADAFRSS